MTRDELIEILQLEPHIEGGYFRRTFDSAHRDPVPTEQGPRLTLSSIYYLLTADSPIGYWHKNQSDILHFWHMGGPVTYQLIHPDGHVETVVLGPDLEGGQCLQLAVRGRSWKASELVQGDYGLISEAVAPGFDYADMELGQRAQLLAQFPAHASLIDRFTKVSA